jgi:hypothetical protein
MRRHLQGQVDTYGEQALVNLVNQKGHEKPVKEAYERFVAEVSLFPCLMCLESGVALILVT